MLISRMARVSKLTHQSRNPCAIFHACDTQFSNYREICSIYSAHIDQWSTAYVHLLSTAEFTLYYNMNVHMPTTAHNCQRKYVQLCMHTISVLPKACSVLLWSVNFIHFGAKFSEIFYSMITLHSYTCIMVHGWVFPAVWKFCTKMNDNVNVTESIVVLLFMIVFICEVIVLITDYFIYLHCIFNAHF